MSSTLLNQNYRKLVEHAMHTLAQMFFLQPRKESRVEILIKNKLDRTLSTNMDTRVDKQKKYQITFVHLENYNGIRSQINKMFQKQSKAKGRSLQVFISPMGSGKVSHRSSHKILQANSQACLIRKIKKYQVTPLYQYHVQKILLNLRTHGERNLGTKDYSLFLEHWQLTCK